MSDEQQITGYTLTTKVLTAAQKDQLAQMLQSESKHDSATNLVVPAGSHLIHYLAGVELQPGIFGYIAVVSGAHGDKITSYLQGRILVYRGQPYNTALNWYVFEEVGSDSITFHVIDLTSGHVALFQHADIIFSFWLAGTSELIYRDISRLKVDSWYGYDVASSKSRCLFVGGETAFSVENGKLLLLVAPREIFVALVETSLGRVIARVLPKDFASLVENPVSLRSLYFASDTATLYVVLQKTGMDYETNVAIRVTAISDLK